VDGPARTADTGEITALLRAWSAGAKEALDRLTPIIYDELKRIARRHMMRERKGHTFQPTELVNEAFLRLVGAAGVHWQDRVHFFALSAQMMRRILVNHALARGAGKRGGGAPRVPLDEALVVPDERDTRIVELDAALDALARVDPRKARTVELRFFAGLSAEETSAVLNVSPQTVHRDWSLAKAWLAREMNRGAGL
jgi:RNA polymerase sigma factor (TIGR02999 family)